MRVLFLTHRLPYAPNRGDRIRAFHIIGSLAPRVDLDVASLVHDDDERAQAERMREAGIASLTMLAVPRFTNYTTAAFTLRGTRPLTHVLLDAPSAVTELTKIVSARPPDVVLAYCSSMARFAMQPPLSHYPFVLDFVDVDSAKWAEMAAAASGPMRWIYGRESRYLARFERDAALRAHAALVVNEREADTLRALAPAASIRTIPNGIDLTAFAPPSAPFDAPRVVFCGVMNYAPNIEGVLWFVRNVWPLIKATRPDAQFSIVGAKPAAAVQRLESVAAGIHVIGAVPEVQTHLWNAAVSVAPLMTARGVQNKVLEALAAGLPTVVTPKVMAGLPREAGPGCLVADTPRLFADHTLSLLALRGEERRAVAARADLSTLSWKRQLAPLYDLLVAAANG